MGQPLYSFALDSENNIISIKEAIKSNSYYCPHCGGLMIPRKGKIYREHFAHKTNPNISCSYETYLHKIAKTRISKCFLESETFNICFNQHTNCNVANCPLNKCKPCSWEEPKTFNLKQYYDTCCLEKGIDEFIADILLTSSTNKNLPPVLIEIFVTHQSTDEKINSSYRIIEIKIQSEDDIDKIVNNNTISESFYHEYKSDVTFHNFRGGNGIPSYQYQAPKYHFWIDDKYFFHRPSPFIGDGEGVYTCLDEVPDKIENSIFRIDSSKPIELDLAFKLFSKCGINKKYCNMCHFYRFNDYFYKGICILYKSKGTVRFPALSVANKCPYFKLKNFDDIPDDKEYRVYIKNGLIDDIDNIFNYLI